MTVLQTSTYIGITNFLLAFALSTNSGTIFYLLIPSCLERKIEVEDEVEVIRHAGSIMAACIWIFFLFDRLSTFFFTRKIINNTLEEYEASNVSPARTTVRTTQESFTFDDVAGAAGEKPIADKDG